MASWHKTPALQWPDNLKLHFLPPYSPELNPQEHLWDELREKFFHNKAFDSMRVLENTLVKGLQTLDNDPQRVH
jgi:transposase